MARLKRWQRCLRGKTSLRFFGCKLTLRIILAPRQGGYQNRAEDNGSTVKSQTVMVRRSSHWNDRRAIAAARIASSHRLFCYFYLIARQSVSNYKAQIPAGKIPDVRKDRRHLVDWQAEPLRQRRAVLIHRGRVISRSGCQNSQNSQFNVLVIRFRFTIQPYPNRRQACH